MVQGVGDASEIAQGLDRAGKLVAMTRGNETVVIEHRMHKCLAYYPVPLKELNAHPSAPTWAGCEAAYLHIVQLNTCTNQSDAVVASSDTNSIRTVGPMRSPDVALSLLRNRVESAIIVGHRVVPLKSQENGLLARFKSWIMTARDTIRRLWERARWHGLSRGGDEERKNGKIEHQEDS